MVLQQPPQIRPNTDLKSAKVFNSVPEIAFELLERVSSRYIDDVKIPLEQATRLSNERYQSRIPLSGSKIRLIEDALEHATDLFYREKALFDRLIDVLKKVQKENNPKQALRIFIYVLLEIEISIEKLAKRQNPAFNQFLMNNSSLNFIWIFIKNAQTQLVDAQLIRKGSIEQFKNTLITKLEFETGKVLPKAIAMFDYSDAAMSKPLISQDHIETNKERLARSKKEIIGMPNTDFGFQQIHKQNGPIVLVPNLLAKKVQSKQPAQNDTTAVSTIKNKSGSNLDLFNPEIREITARLDEAIPALFSGFKEVSQNTEFKRTKIQCAAYHKQLEDLNNRIKNLKKRAQSDKKYSKPLFLKRLNQLWLESVFYQKILNRFKRGEMFRKWIGYQNKQVSSGPKKKLEYFRSSITRFKEIITTIKSLTKDEKHKIQLAHSRALQKALGENKTQSYLLATDIAGRLSDLFFEERNSQQAAQVREKKWRLVSIVNSAQDYFIQF